MRPRAVNGYRWIWPYPVYLVRDDGGAPWAAIECRSGELPSGPMENVDGHWTFSTFASLRRVGRETVLDASFAPVRVRCLSESAAEFVGRCARGAPAANAHERELVQYAARAGLLERCIGDATSASETDEGPSAWWTYEEGRLWECFALADGTPEPRGVKPPERRRQLPPPARESDEQSTEGDIRLVADERVERAIPHSAPAFSDVPVDAVQLGRWFGRFARVRTTHWASREGHRHETVTRGMPEAGGLAALRLWPAVHRVDGVPRGLYAYNAFDHTLRRAGDDIERILRLSVASMGGIGAEPAGVIIISNRVRRMGAKYRRIGLGLALQNAGVCIAAAAVAGEREGICVRGNGFVPGDDWIEATNIDPRFEAPVAAFAFGR